MIDSIDTNFLQDFFAVSLLYIYIRRCEKLAGYIFSALGSKFIIVFN